MHLIITFTGTQLSTLKTKMVAFASSSSTFNLTPTFSQLLTVLSNWWECHPHYLPNVILFPPNPVGRTLHIHLINSCLAPDTGSLISCTLDVLCKRCPCLSLLVEWHHRTSASEQTGQALLHQLHQQCCSYCTLL